MILTRLRILVGVLVTLSCLQTEAMPVYPLWSEPYQPVPAGTSESIWNDWTAIEPALELSTKPDRSWRSIWVRLFPILSAPLGDPYPETQNINYVSLVNPKGFKVFALANESLLGHATSVQFDFHAGKMVLGNQVMALQPVWIVPATSELSLAHWDKGNRNSHGKNLEVRVRLRGGFIVKPTTFAPRGSPPRPPQAVLLWSLINVVNVNDYLRSVVPSEVIAGWHPETLRAQAIAARTYGLFEVITSRNQGLDFDVDPTTWYQSYQGVQFWQRDQGAWRSIELKATNAAVSATGGNVIIHNGEVIKAYFSANSGGHSCLATECLENEPINPPYIHEIKDHPSVKSAPGGTWGRRSNLTAAAIKSRLKDFGFSFEGTVAKLEPAERGPSGRTWRLRLRMTDGRTIELDRFLTRKVMHLFGPIRSYLYELGSVGKDGRQKIVGHGYGHGVGMSQWGAQLYAKQGWSAAKILAHFYRGVAIKDLSAGRFVEEELTAN